MVKLTPVKPHHKHIRFGILKNILPLSLLGAKKKFQPLATKQNTKISLPLMILLLIPILIHLFLAHFLFFPVYMNIHILSTINTLILPSPPYCK